MAISPTIILLLFKKYYPRQNLLELGIKYTYTYLVLCLSNRKSRTNCATRELLDWFYERFKVLLTKNSWMWNTYIFKHSSEQCYSNCASLRIWKIFEPDLLHVLFSLCQLVKNYSHRERGNLNWWMTTKKLAYGRVWGGIFLINGWCGSGTYYGRHQPSQVLIGWTRNQPEQAMESNPINHIPSLFLLCSCLTSGPNFLWWLNVIRTCKPKKSIHSSNWL